jgi:soluble P-type ATPase
MKYFWSLFLFIMLMSTACRQQSEKRTDKTIKQAPDNIIADTGTVKHNNPLPSWRDTETKNRITAFVKSAVNPEDSGYIPPQKRIVTIDNDGTLWPEKPTYFQIEFVLYRIRRLYPSHPEWKKNKLIKAAMKHDLTTLRKKYGAKGLGKLMTIAQSGMTTEKYKEIVLKWINTAKHPKTGKLYTDMVYQPMLELIKYLQDNDFKVYIVSGGGVDFMRAWGEKVYGIPCENFLGSLQILDYEKRGGKPVLIRTSNSMFVNNSANKAVLIHQIIGRKPVMAIGNSDKDIEMLEWSASNTYNSFQIFIHHTDSEREWAYDRGEGTGRLNRGLDIAKKRNWLLVDMKNDWSVIYKENTVQ